LIIGIKRFWVKNRGFRRAFKIKALVDHLLLGRGFNLGIGSILSLCGGGDQILEELGNSGILAQKNMLIQCLLAKNAGRSFGLYRVNLLILTPLSES